MSRLPGRLKHDARHQGPVCSTDPQSGYASPLPLVQGEVPFVHKKDLTMAQILVNWFICDGKFRVHATNAIGSQPSRVIEIERVETGERFHGSPRKLERALRMLQSCYRGED
jgi:hypothetical protein